LLRAGTAVDSNYDSAQRARTHREFTSRVGVAYDEASESLGWLRILKSTPHANGKEFTWLFNEADELTRILNKSFQTARTQDEAERKERQQRRNGRRQRDAR